MSLRNWPKRNEESEVLAGWLQALQSKLSLTRHLYKFRLRW